MEKTIKINGTEHTNIGILEEIITRKKYRFSDKQVISAVIDDIFEIFSDAEKKERIDFEETVSNMNKIAAKRCREMQSFGNQKADFYTKRRELKKAFMYRQWAYHKELKAEYHESKI